MSLSILLLQAREADDKAKDEERLSFSEMAGIDVEQVVPLDLLAETPTLDQITAHDALMVGGSGAYYVTKGNLPGFQKLMELLREVGFSATDVFFKWYNFCGIVAVK